MSKYIDKSKGYSNIGYSNIGNRILLSNIDDNLKNEIFSNINSISYPKLYDLITPSIKLSFIDKDKNSVVHTLLNVNNRTIPEDTKLKLLKFFIKRGAPINTYNQNKKTPLHLAIENSHHMIVKFLLDSGANPNAETINNLTVLQLALDATPIGCHTDIIPKELYPEAKENKNELTQEIATFVKANYDISFNPYITAIFDDYLKEFQTIKANKELLTNIKTEILKILNSDLPEAEIKYDITEKKKVYIQNIANNLLVDNTTIDDNLLKKSPDVPTMKVEYIQLKKDAQKFLDGSIKQEYDSKLAELNDFIANFKEFRQNFINIFRFKLFLLSKLPVKYKDINNFPEIEGNLFIYNDLRGGVPGIVPIQPPPGIDKDSFGIYDNGIPGGGGNANQMVRIPAVIRYIYFSDDYRELDNITFHRNPNITKKIKQYKDDYNDINMLYNTFFNNIDINLFRINPLVNSHESYKFIILNYIKICFIR
jgi:ankyrin repeat protein